MIPSTNSDCSGPGATNVVMYSPSFSHPTSIQPLGYAPTVKVS